MANKLRPFEIALCAAVSLCLLAGAWAQHAAGELSGSLIRLHVVAASDSEEDQALKLRVRDAVLAYLTPELEGAASPEEAAAVIAAHMEEIEAAAAGASQGQPVLAGLSREYYPTRVYGGFALPAGRYSSLRVVIGEGEGHNWWCVVFPPLCMDAASESPFARLDDSQVSLITGYEEDYVLRFKLLELWGALTGRLGGAEAG